MISALLSLSMAASRGSILHTALDKSFIGDKLLVLKPSDDIAESLTEKFNNLAINDDDGMKDRGF